MSNQKRIPLVSEILTAMREHYESTDAVDNAGAGAFDVNRTDLRLLSILDRSGPLTMGALTAAAGLSKPAMTTAVDRLAEAGFVVRAVNSNDRRSSTVVISESARQRIADVYGPLQQAGRALLDEFTVEELDVLRRFLSMTNDMQQSHAARVRSLTEDDEIEVC